MKADQGPEGKGSTEGPWGEIRSRGSPGGAVCLSHMVWQAELAKPRLPTSFLPLSLSSQPPSFQSTPPSSLPHPKTQSTSGLPLGIVPSPILPLHGLGFWLYYSLSLGLEVACVCISFSATPLGVPGKQRHFDLPFLSLQSQQCS